MTETTISIRIYRCVGYVLSRIETDITVGVSASIACLRRVVRGPPLADHAINHPCVCNILNN